jgi:transposase
VGDTALILKVRFTCKACGRTFTPPIRGVSRYATVSDLTKAQIRNEFLTNQTFSSIARRYGVDESYAVRLFDADYPTVPGLRLPEVMCIDEIRFNRRDDERFPCVVYDWRRREVVDLAVSRRREFLDDFFSSKRQEELDGVRYFVSDMYDAYAAVKRVYFPKAIHIVDFFHVAALLTNAVGKLRVNAMNALEKGSPEYAFMKSKWRLFLCRRSKVPDKTITRRNGEVEHYDDLLFRCVRSTRNLWDGYDILQELLSYREYDTFTEAIAFVERISGRLQSCPSELLKTVGRSYWHWRVEIASGLARNQSGEHFSNGVAEGLNNQIKTIKKVPFTRGWARHSRNANNRSSPSRNTNRRSHHCDSMKSPSRKA